MIVFLPAKIRATGGSSTFAVKLQQGLSSKNIKVVFSYTPKFDILLVNSVCPLRYLLMAKITRRPIIHRLDGVYYPMTVARLKYIFYNLPLQIILHFFADAIIYQSKYSQMTCHRFLGVNNRIPRYLIYNGVNTNLFSTVGPIAPLRDFPDQPIFISASRFRRTDQVLPIIDAFHLYSATYNSTAKLYFIGDFNDSLTQLPDRYKNQRSIIFTGPVPNNKLSEYYRAADVFLFTHLNPPCPNNIIEAMSCGLPICGVADGAMTEITSPGLNSELIPAPGTGFYQPRRLDLQLFAANLNKIMQNLNRYSTHSRQSAIKTFALPPMVSSYRSVFQAVR